MSGLRLDVSLPPEAIEAIAERAAEIMLERQAQQSDGYLDVEGAAAFLACHPNRIYALKSAGRIPFHKDGSRLLFERTELRDWVRNGGGKRP